MQWQDSRISGGYEYLYASRMRADGSRPPGWPADGLRVTAIESFQSVSAMVDDGGGGAYFAFGTTAPSTTSYIQHLRADGSVAMGRPATGLMLGPRAQSPQLCSDGADRLRYEDTAVTAGARYAYRLGWIENGAERFTSESWVEVPGAATLALEGLRPNPAVDALNVSFSLASAGAASVELLDVTGRRLASREVGSLGAGRHVVRLDRDERPAPGMYWLRLRQGEQQLMARAVVMR